MPMFVLNRDRVISGKGHRIAFKKGQPTHVPPEMVQEAIGIGADPVDADKDDLLPKDAAPEEHLSDADREAMIFAAFDQIVASATREDFGGDGKPTVDAVKRISGVSTTRKEIVSLFQKYREQKAAEAE